MFFFRNIYAGGGSIEIVLHLGPCKVASTFLQHKIFEKIPEAHFTQDILYPDLQNEKTNILSNEHFMACPYHEGEYKQMFSLLQNLHSLYPSAKVVLGHRNWESWSQSLYNQYVRQGGVETYKQFMNMVIDWQFEDLTEYYELLHALFESKVHIFSFERLKENPQKVVQNICEFAELPVYDFDLQKTNLSYTPSQLKLVRGLNTFFKSRFHKEGRFNRNVKLNPEDLIVLFRRHR